MKKLHRVMLWWLLPGLLGFMLLWMLAMWFGGSRNVFSIGLPFPAAANFARTIGLQFGPSADSFMIRIEHSEIDEVAKAQSARKVVRSYFLEYHIQRGLHFAPDPYDNYMLYAPGPGYAARFRALFAGRFTASGNSNSFVYRSTTDYQITVPFWSAVGAVSLALIATLYLRRRPQMKPGHCTRCGYDLRATPDRCPECGAVAAIPTVQSGG